MTFGHLRTTGVLISCTKQDRSPELKSVFHECTPGRRKIAVEVVDIFGNDTMTIFDVSVGKNRGKK
jgi:hypothetical protein